MASLLSVDYDQNFDEGADKKEDGMLWQERTQKKTRESSLIHPTWFSIISELQIPPNDEIYVLQ